MEPVRVIRLAILIAATLPCVCAAQQPAHGETELDIAFVPGGGPEQQLDLYTPATRGFPTILFVHEGGLTSGDRQDPPYAQMCQTFQAMGIACAATNYRLAPGHKWPDQPTDVTAAFGWLKRNIAERGGDPRRIFLFGHSSGCLLVAMVAADPVYLTSQGMAPADVAGVVAMGCRLNDVVTVSPTRPPEYESSWVPPDKAAAFMAEEVAFTSLAQRNDAVPASHVTAALPRTLVLVAEGERFFPPVLRDGAEFVGRAQVLNVDADLAILPGRTHRTAIQSMVVPTDEGVVLVAGFINRH